MKSISCIPSRIEENALLSVVAAVASTSQVFVKTSDDTSCSTCSGVTETQTQDTLSRRDSEETRESLWTGDAVGSSAESLSASFVSSGADRRRDEFEGQVDETIRAVLKPLLNGRGLSSGDVAELKRVTVELCRRCGEPAFDLTLRDHLQVWARSLRDVLFKDEREEEIKAFVAEHDKQTDVKTCPFSNIWQTIKNQIKTLLNTQNNKESSRVEAEEEDRIKSVFLALAELYMKGEDVSKSSVDIPASFDRATLSAWIMDTQKFDLLLQDVSSKIFARLADGFKNTRVSHTTLSALNGLRIAIAAN